MTWHFPNESILRKRSLIVREILEESQIKLEFELLSTDLSLENKLSSKVIYRPQFLLAGFNDDSDASQLFILGDVENHFLKTLPEEQKEKAIRMITLGNMTCLILADNVSLNDNLLQILSTKNVAILRTKTDVNTVIDVLSSFLTDHFSPQMVVHGTFCDVHGTGILFVGRSAIGKSEVALDLVERGHRLVADDTVMLTKNAATTIMGTSTKLAKHFMEIRGLGIIDVRAMFGVRAVRFQKRVEIIVELEQYNQDNEYTRTGLENSIADVMGVNLEYLKLPIFPGKNITVIVEAIALNYLLRTYGYNPAKVMTDNLQSNLLNRPVHEDKFQTQRLINFFQGDKE
ncbi:MAG: HPr(Ser) kinase/phosphatase [Ignavibacteria bacterium GWF2_33_9]|nr:MAG: HPr(Ser) kinase/phosphatase [Ignavibacteria bacterium GWF2_33_9]